MKCLFAYNPVSGTGKIKKKLGYIVKKLSEKYTSVEVYKTKQAGDLARIAKESCGKYDAFIFSGGDGTVNEVINGFAEQKNKPILGYIPTGTVNDVARSLGIKRTLKGALKNILQGNVGSFDVMKLNDRYAFYAVACGTMTSCSYMTDQKEKKKIGKVAYAVYALKHDFEFKKFKVKYSYDNVVGETDAVIILIINSKSVSTFRVDNEAVLDDGLVDVAIITDTYNKKELGFFRRVRNLFKSAFLFVFGFKNFKKQRKMVSFTTSSAKFEVSEDLGWNFDGEKGVKGVLNLNVLQNEVKFIVPKSSKIK